MAVPVGKSKYKEGVIGDFYTRNITAKTKVEFLGNWEKVGDIFSKLPKDIQVIVYRAIYQYTLLYHQQVLRAIKKNGPSSVKWEPYSKMYARVKRAYGTKGFPSYYRFQGNLIRAIIVETDGRKHVRVTMDKKARVTNFEGSLNASQLMNVLEHGSVKKGIAARPLFGPVWRDMGGNRALRDFVSKKIGRKLKSYSSQI